MSITYTHGARRECGAGERTGARKKDTPFFYNAALLRFSAFAHTRHSSSEKTEPARPAIAHRGVAAVVVSPPPTAPHTYILTPDPPSKIWLEGSREKRDQHGAGKAIYVRPPAVVDKNIAIHTSKHATSKGDIVRSASPSK